MWKTGVNVEKRGKPNGFQSEDNLQMAGGIAFVYIFCMFTGGKKSKGSNWQKNWVPARKVRKDLGLATIMIMESWVHGGTIYSETTLDEGFNFKFYQPKYWRFALQAKGL